jgi:hypothetical protein
MKSRMKPKQRAVDRALRSRRFQNWMPVYVERRTAGHSTDHVTEQHFSPADLSKTWGLSVDTIRAIFADEPGVIKHRVSTGKRPYTTLRIPFSVAARVHTRISS